MLWRSVTAAAIEDPPVIVKILRHLGLPSHARPTRRRIESIYSQRLFWVVLSTLDNLAAPANR